MKKNFFTTFFYFLLIFFSFHLLYQRWSNNPSSLVDLDGKVLAQGWSTPTAPPPLTPPHPYPSPDNWAEFPKPGNAIRYYLDGKLVEDITDLVKYFRSDSFRRALEDIYSTASANPYPGSASQQNFEEIKQRALTAINDFKQKIDRKVQNILNEPSLNDRIGRSIDEENTTIDEGIKKEISDFYDQIITKFNDIYARMQNAANTEQLKALIMEAKNYWGSNEIQTQFKTLGSKVFGQRLRYFAKMIQNLVEFNNCLAPQMDAAFNPYNGNAFLYRRYVYANRQTRFNETWYRETQFDSTTNPWFDWTTFWYRYLDTPPEVPQDSRDPQHGTWYTTFGAKKEYLAAADMAGLFTNTEFGFRGNECVGAPSRVCKDTILMHMRAGKRQLQDMFHIAWWEYDYIVQMSEQGVIFVPDFRQCPIPEIRFHQRSGSGPTGFPPFNTREPNTPTPRPTKPTGTGGRGGR